MPFNGRSVADQRLDFVRLASEGTRSVSELSRMFGISRQAGYRWLKLYREQGAAAVVVERSRRPHHSPRLTDSSISNAIVDLRRQWPDWGAAKLRRVLIRHHPGWAYISRSTVHRILVREGLVRRQDRHAQAWGEFERSAPNELWQMDFKGPKGFRRRPGPLSVLDDHSRYLLALEHLENGRVDAVRGCLRRTFERSGLPDAMLTDHGTPWWNANSPWGWTELSVWLMRQGIRILLSGFRHPQTQGKVERMHGVLCRAIRRRGGDADEQNWLDRFREEYNLVRPHEALDMQTPAERWERSKREYQAVPKPWQYAASQQVERVNESGRIRWRGKWFDLSRALAGELVGVEMIAGRTLVYFCNTPLTELEPETGSSIPLPIDPFRSLQC